MKAGDETVRSNVSRRDLKNVDTEKTIFLKKMPKGHIEIKLTKSYADFFPP